MRGSCIVVQLVVIRVIRVIRFSIIYIVYTGIVSLVFFKSSFPLYLACYELSFCEEANLIE